MLTRLTLWLAARILRRRRYSPACPIAKHFASWAARTIGKPGRDRWNQERRWRKACAWANADLARRDREYALWLAQNAPVTAPKPQPLAPTLPTALPTALPTFYGAINTFADAPDPVNIDPIDPIEFCILLDVMRDGHRRELDRVVFH